MTRSIQRKHVAFAAAGLAMSSLPAAALEAEDVLMFSKDPVVLLPQFSITEVYSDNIFSESVQQTADFLTLLSPGLKARLGRIDGNYIQLNYRFTQYFYADNDHLNTSEHSIGLASNLEWSKLKISGADQFSFLSSPLNGEERIGLTPGSNQSNVDRLTISDNYIFTYQLTEKTSAYAEASYRSADYEEGVRLFDYNTWTGTGGFNFNAFSQTTFFGEIYYGQTASSRNTPVLKNPHMTFVGGFLGARGNFTEKLSGMAKAGYESREFSDNSPAPSAPVVNAALTYAFSDRTAVILSYTRLNDVSVQEAQSAYTLDRASLTLRQMLGSSGKWIASVTGSYSNYEYEQLVGDRSTQIFNGDLSLSYQIQEWLYARAGYNFESYSSEFNTSEFDYQSNRITLSLGVGY